MLRIPSIQLCDTQSFFDKITYPIVANQRSVPLTYLLIHLFAELCTNALIDSHLSFISYGKYLTRGLVVKKRFKRLNLRKRRRKKNIKYIKKYEKGTLQKNKKEEEKDGLPRQKLELD
jgi:hypothetical protein